MQGEMKAKIDWKALALQLGTLNETGEIGSERYGRQAIETLLGEDNLRAAVDYYISGAPGSELARNVLWVLRPWSAMKYCYDIYKSQVDIEERRLAVELLRAVADARALPWVDEFLDDADVGIQLWGASLLEQLVYWNWIDVDEAEDVIHKAETHSNPSVRKQAEFIRELKNRSSAKVVSNL